MAQYDEIGRVYRKRKENPWPAIITVVVVIVILANLGG